MRNDDEKERNNDWKENSGQGKEEKKEGGRVIDQSSNDSLGGQGKGWMSEAPL